MAVSVSLSRFAGDLWMANRVDGTIQHYVASVRRFEEFLGHDLADASQESVRRWVDHLRGQAIGASRLGQHYAALKFLYARTLGQPDKVAWITIPKVKAHLPSILARSEVQRLLGGFIIAKYRMFFTLVYATGLRITEASRLETQDIDSMLKVIHGTTGEKPMDRFPAEKAALRPLGNHPSYLRVRHLSRRVAAVGRLDVDTNRYSVPPRFIGATLKVTIEADTLQVFCQDRVIAEHVVHPGRHQAVEDPDHAIGFHNGLTQVGKPSEIRALSAWSVT